ncbi:MAG: LysR family transcriptional regulator [Gemmatimonadales bacterium]|nr:LysR family transcriptional regulator [Gemmatimonadales bacterium]
MDSGLLRAFLETAEAGTLSRAARTLGVAQPSLSLQIQRLERHLGTPLFRRHGRGMTLTDAGEALLPRARRIVEEVRAAEEAFRQRDGALAVLHVGAIPTVAPYVLPDALRRLRARDATRRVAIREEVSAALARQLAEGTLDVAIAAQPFAFDGLEVEVLGVDPLVVAVPAHHPAARAGAITLAALRQEPAITLDAAHCLGHQVAEFCARRGVAPSVACRGAQLATVLELVAAGVGVSIVPAMAAARAQGLACAFVPVADAAPARDIVAVRRPGAPPVAAAFVECVRSVLRGW